MNSPDKLNLTQVNKEAVYNVYSYLANKDSDDNRIKNGDNFEKIVEKLEKSCNAEYSTIKWDDDEKRQLEVLKAAVLSDDTLAKSQIDNQVSVKGGLSACTFTDGKGNVSVVYRGTGRGEWLDNGQGLSGVPQTNTYIIPDGKAVVENDYASTQQVDALNWFNEIAKKNNWTKETNIIVSGHSKGGNKAQFVAIKSDLVDECYSFDGQGFSPEAIEQLQKSLGDKFEERQSKLFSISAENDFINVLGKRLVPKENIYFVSSPLADDNFVGNHYADALLDDNGKLNVFCEQGEISEYIEGLSDTLMGVTPSIRQYATNGLMSMIQNIKGETLDGKKVSTGETVLGVCLAGLIVRSSQINKTDEISAIIELVRTYSDDLLELVVSGMEKISLKFTPERSFGEIFAGLVSIAFTTPYAIVKDSSKRLTSYLDSLYDSMKSKLIDIDVEMYHSVSIFVSTVSSIASSSAYNAVQQSGAYCTNNPYICANTELMWQYANRLLKVASKLAKLQARLSVLDRKNDSSELERIMKSDSLVKYNWLIVMNRKYLTETADELYRIELDIYNRF